MSRWILAGVGFLAAVVIFSTGSIYGIDRAASYAVGIHAERKALHWSAHSLEAIKEVDGGDAVKDDTHHHEQQLSPQDQALHESDEHQPEDGTQQSVISVPIDIGVDDDILHLKLFNASGKLLVVSGEDFIFHDKLGFQVSLDKISRVASSGEAVMTIHKTNEASGLPPVVAEVYVPVAFQSGAEAGAAEVIVDVSSIYSLFRRIISNIALGLLAVFAVVFSVPYLAFHMKRVQERRIRERVAFLAKYDPMTHLLNRTSFTNTLQEKASNSDLPPVRAGFVCLDIDEFKSINDTYGHKAGDEFLKHVGRSICQNTGPQDVVGRIGGDGFAFVLCDRSRQQVQELVDTIRMAIAMPVHHEGVTFAGTASFGIHFDEKCTLHIDERMHKADMALFQAKENGRNASCFFSQSIENELMRRRFIEAELRRGLKENSFELYFQPLLNRETMKCSGFEALLRLRDSNGELLPPEEFVPVAESMGVIDEIGTWVLNQATKVAATWPDHLFVAVNLSPSQFATGKLVKTVKNVLKTSGLAARRLELEVTESLLMESTDSVAEQLNALRDLNVLLAMDDFGTGYSSLGYLWQFGFDKLKIDRSFIIGLDENNEKAREILDTIIMLGHRLDMTVVAEGIETPEQAALLTALRCDQFQGFLYSKPVPMTELAQFFFVEFSDEMQNKKEAQTKAA